MFKEALHNEESERIKERSGINIIKGMDSLMSDSISKKISPHGTMQYNTMNNSSIIDNSQLNMTERQNQLPLDGAMAQLSLLKFKSAGMTVKSNRRSKSQPKQRTAIYDPILQYKERA